MQFIRAGNGAAFAEFKSHKSRLYYYVVAKQYFVKLIYEQTVINSNCAERKIIFN